LVNLNGVAEASAIISLLGTRCGRNGNWLALTGDEQQWATYWNDLSQATARGLYYRRQKHIVIQAVGDRIIASCGKEGLILQKARIIFVAAR
jgi:hypothetical protein